MAGAFVGLMAGVGFASGQEVLQFFTSFGWFALAGALLTALLMGFLVMSLYQIGCRLQTRSHKEAMDYICGPWLGPIMDVLLTFFLFGTLVVMLAGAGSSLQQQLGAPQYLGGILVGALCGLIVCFGIDSVITLMSLVTPVLATIIAIIACYALGSMRHPFQALVPVALQQPRAAGNWLLSAWLYVSFNIAATGAMLVVMGGSVTDLRKAGRGGLLGGLGIGVLIAVMSLALLARVDEVSGNAVPTLYLSNRLSPWFGDLMLLLLQVKLLITAVGLTYALAARCEGFGLSFKGSAGVAILLAYGASLLGFVKLVGLVYPAMGYMGSVLVVAIIVAWFRLGRSASVASL